MSSDGLLIDIDGHSIPWAFMRHDLCNRIYNAKVVQISAGPTLSRLAMAILDEILRVLDERVQPPDMVVHHLRGEDVFRSTYFRDMLAPRYQLHLTIPHGEPILEANPLFKIMEVELVSDETTSHAMLVRRLSISTFPWSSCGKQPLDTWDPPVFTWLEAVTIDLVYKDDPCYYLSLHEHLPYLRSLTLDRRSSYLAFTLEAKNTSKRKHSTPFDATPFPSMMYLSVDFALETEHRWVVAGNAIKRAYPRTFTKLGLHFQLKHESEARNTGQSATRLARSISSYSVRQLVFKSEYPVAFSDENIAHTLAPLPRLRIFSVNPYPNRQRIPQDWPLPTARGLVHAAELGRSLGSLGLYFTSTPVFDVDVERHARQTSLEPRKLELYFGALGGREEDKRSIINFIKRHRLFKLGMSD